MYVCSEKMKKALTIVLMIIFVIHFCVFLYFITNAPNRGVVTGKIWTKSAKYLVIENDGQSGFVWVSWSVYFNAEKGDIYDTTCECIVEQP